MCNSIKFFEQIFRENNFLSNITKISFTKRPQILSNCYLNDRCNIISYANLDSLNR